MNSAALKRELDLALSVQRAQGEKQGRLQREYIERYDELGALVLKHGGEHVADPGIQRRLKDRALKSAELIENIKQATVRLQTKQSERSELQTKIQNLLTVRNQHLQDKAYSPLEQAVMAAWAAYEEQQIIWQDTAQELDDLLKTYADNTYYSYLKKRNNSPGRWGLQAKLEGWLARQINFTDNCNKETMLRRSAAYNEAQLAEAAKRLEQAEQRQSEAIMALEAKLKLTDAFSVQHNLDGEILSIEKELAPQSDLLREMEHGLDNDFQILRENLQKVIKDMSWGQLRQLVLSTPTPEDDLVLDRLEKLAPLLSQSNNDLEAANNTVQSLQAQYQARRMLEVTQNLALEWSISRRMGGFGSSGGHSRGRSWGGRSGSFGGGGHSSSGSFGGGGSRTTGKF